MDHPEAVKVGQCRGVLKLRLVGDKLGADTHITKISPTDKLRLDQCQLTADLSAKSVQRPPERQRP